MLDQPQPEGSGRGPGEVVFRLLAVAAGLVGMGLVGSAVTGMPLEPGGSGPLDLLVAAAQAGFVFAVMIVIVGIVVVGFSMTVFTSVRTGLTALVRPRPEPPDDASEDASGNTSATTQAPAPVAVASAIAPPAPFLPLEEAEDEPEEYWSDQVVEGWRVWVWTRGGLWGVQVEWPTDRLTATCQTCPEVPSWSHTCGIYAVKDPRDMFRVVRPWVTDEVVVGRVALSGMVIEHDIGYRAEHAQIVELYARREMLDVLAAVFPDVLVCPRDQYKKRPWPP